MWVATSVGMSAVNSDMSEFLTVVTLLKAILSFMCLHFNYVTTKACKLEDIPGLIRPRYNEWEEEQ
jgi:hypothetical protein